MKRCFSIEKVHKQTYIIIVCLSFDIRSNVRTPAISQRLPAPEVFRDHQRSLAEFGIWLERLPKYIVALLCLNIHVLRFYLTKSKDMSCYHETFEFIIVS